METTIGNIVLTTAIDTAVTAIYLIVSLNLIAKTYDSWDEISEHRYFVVSSVGFALNIFISGWLIIFFEPQLTKTVFLTTTVVNFVIFLILLWPTHTRMVRILKNK